MTSYIANQRLQIRELKQRLVALKRLDLRRTDLDYLKKQLAPILHHYVHPTPLLQPGERIFRAVRWPERPAHLGQLSYPPSHLVPSYGRINRPNESVFYGSVGSAAAIQELAPTDKCRLVVSMWRVAKTIPVASIGYSKDAFAKLGSNRWSEIWWRKSSPLESEPIGAQTPENRFLDSFLAKEMTRKITRGQEWQYKLSVAIAETFLKGKPASTESISNSGIFGLTRPGEIISGMSAGGIVYPSIATSANNDNVALKCEIVDECLEFAWTHYIEIERSSTKADEFTPKGLDFANGLSASGDIVWTGSFPNILAPGTDLRIDIENGALVLKDSSNQIAGKFSQ